MILYNITISIENSVADEWLTWMKEVHIPEVMDTGYFLRNQISRMLDEVDNGGTTYAVQYYCNSLEDLQEYQQNHAPALQAKQNERYANKFAAFRTALEVIATDVERN